MNRVLMINYWSTKEKSKIIVLNALHKYAKCLNYNYRLLLLVILINKNNYLQPRKLELKLSKPVFAF